MFDSRAQIRYISIIQTRALQKCGRIFAPVQPDLRGVFMVRVGNFDNIGVPSATAIAADEHVAAEGVSYDGCVNLLGAFWQLVRKDLEVGRYDVHTWLTSEDFAQWCGSCGVEPGTLREHLLENHWRRRDA